MIESNINKIVAKDFYGDNCLKGSLDQMESTTRFPKGWVELYEVDEKGSEKLISKSNLVVYLGRETIAQRMFGLENEYSLPTKDETISWVGIGSGGVNTGDPFNPSPPVSTEIDLVSELPISSTDTTCADLKEGFYYKKPIESITFEQDTYNNNSWLIAKTISRISLSDSIDSHISEAGLFTSEGGQIPGYAGPFHLFSKVTFPTVVKTNTRQLLFIWYIYF